MEWITTTACSELMSKVSGGKEFMDCDELFTAVLTPRTSKSLRKVAEQSSLVCFYHTRQHAMQCHPDAS